MRLTKWEVPLNKQVKVTVQDQLDLYQAVYDPKNFKPKIGFAVEIKIWKIYIYIK